MSRNKKNKKNKTKTKKGRRVTQRKAAYGPIPQLTQVFEMLQTQMDMADDGFLYIQHTEGASPVYKPSNQKYGHAVEDTLRSNHVLSTGLEDFIFKPNQVLTEKGTSREISDGMLISGNFAVVIQSKAQDPEETPYPSEEKCISWHQKNGKKASSQVRGTMRSLARLGTHTMTSERGEDVPIDFSSCKMVGVVVFDSPRTPDDFLPSNQDFETRVPIVYLTREDWEFLNSQIRSAAGMITYLHRVSSQLEVPLGYEGLRYYQLATADQSLYDADANKSIILGPGVTRETTVELLVDPYSETEDAASNMVHRLLQEVADSRLLYVPQGETPDKHLSVRRVVLEILDALPTDSRKAVATKLDQLRRRGWTKTDPIPASRFRYQTSLYHGQIFLAVHPGWEDPQAQAKLNHLEKLMLLRHEEYKKTLPEGVVARTAGLILRPSDEHESGWETLSYCKVG